METLSVIWHYITQMALFIGIYLGIGATYSIWWFWLLNKRTGQLYSKSKQRYLNQGKTPQQASEFALKAATRYIKRWSDGTSVPIVVSEHYWVLTARIIGWWAYIIATMVDVKLKIMLYKLLVFMVMTIPIKVGIVIRKGILWYWQAMGYHHVAKKIANEVYQDFKL